MQWSIIPIKNVVVIMLIINKVISPNGKLIIATEVRPTLDVIKEYIYENPMNLMLQWWERNVIIILIIFQSMK